MDKRQRILETAVELFAEKGHNQTSMQEISDKIGISKGSLYSYFESKEDLIISIYEHYQQLVFERAYVVEMSGEQLPLDQLAKQFQVQFEGILEYKSYMKIHMRGETVKNNEKLKAMEHRMQGRFFSWLEFNLLKIYGEKINRYKWDIILMTQSIYRSYMMLLVSMNAPLDPVRIGQHITRQLDLMMNDFIDGNSHPLLSDEIMRPFSVQMDKEGAFVSFEKRERAWKSLYFSISQLCEEKTSYYKSIATRIADEMSKAIPEMIVVRGMFLLLKQEKLLAEAAGQLEKQLVDSE